jgi:integrase
MANDHEAKEPFTDQEIALMYATAKGRYGKEVYLKSVDERVIEFSSGAKLTKGYDMVVDISTYRHSVTGEDLCDFIAVALWTGLRISDVATFHIDRLLPSGKVRLRPLKTGHKWVEILIPGWLENRIRERARIHGPLIFGKHETDDLDTITDQWRRKLIRLWKLCGLQGRSPKPHPHRFRHTFARIQLQHGLSPAEVAHILGNTEVIVIKHYSTWVREHQEKLDASMRRALSSFEGHDALVIPSA